MTYLEKAAKYTKTLSKGKKVLCLGVARIFYELDAIGVNVWGADEDSYYAADRISWVPRKNHYFDMRQLRKVLGLEYFEVFVVDGPEFVHGQDRNRMADNLGAFGRGTFVVMDTHKEERNELAEAIHKWLKGEKKTYTTQGKKFTILKPPKPAAQ